MMEAPVVSIVMAAYNEERYIEESIRSILNQTFTSFEFIIINDGSTDKTEAIILSFNDPRIVYVRNSENLKLIASLNKGLRLSRGKYIARMDADDIALPERLIKQVAFMEHNPKIGLSGARLEVFGNSEGFMNYPLTHEEIRLNLLISSSFGNNVVIFRSQILKEYNLYFLENYLHCEDYKTWTQWVKVTKTANLPDVLVRYRSHSASVSVKYNSIQKQIRNLIRKEYIKETFPGLADHVIESVTGPPSFKKTRAYQQILRENRKHPVFDQFRLKDTLSLIWYLDCLEGVVNDTGVLIKFPLIFRIDFKSNFKRWINIFKHLVKLKLIQK